MTVIKCPRQNTTLNEERVTLAHVFWVQVTWFSGLYGYDKDEHHDVWVEENSFLHDGQEPKKDGQGASVSLRICPNVLLLVIHFLKLSKPYNSTTG